MAGRPLQFQDPNGAVTTRSYVGNARLATRSAAGIVTSYEYDPMGNLTKVTFPGGAWLQYRIASITGAFNRTYAYDAAGNTTSDGTTSYGYNDAGRMVSAIT